jgi:cyclopropane fatty-acyl-phospholipid synthase-like methyltransferase
VEQSEIDIISLYETHARSCDPKDFQSQVMRTPHGKPVGEDQVALIVAGIKRNLQLEANDILLDLCCGNGVITDRIFAGCRGGVGVDFTPYLVEVAQRNFQQPPARTFRLADALEYTETTDECERFTKVMCYGAFQCLIESKAIGLLRTLERRFPNLQRVLLGNLPDLDCARIFWRQDVGSEPWSIEQLRRHDTPFGTWRSEAEVKHLTTECGWNTEISRMPLPYFCAHYRFDAVLTRSPTRQMQ